ncbi:MAG TPA: DUF5615 family PIN-like protein [Isosphaeraceae bacterium]|nr:DUF5615 family PIN-like protein [Isosphaeraceae bacterium]
MDVSTTPEAGLAGSSDEEQMAYALEQGRVIFTQDDDFLRLHAAGVLHAGIVYCHQQSRSLGEMITGLTLLHESYDADEMKGRVEYL